MVSVYYLGLFWDSLLCLSAFLEATDLLVLSSYYQSVKLEVTVLNLESPLLPSWSKFLALHTHEGSPYSGQSPLLSKLKQVFCLVYTWTFSLLSILNCWGTVMDMSDKCAWLWKPGLPKSTLMVWYMFLLGWQQLRLLHVLMKMIGVLSE